jgi:hypothetical protein
VNILTYEEKNGMLRVTTDTAGISEFVYPIGRFADIESLKAEITKKVTEVQKRSSNAVVRKENLLLGLEQEKERNK